MNYRVEDIVATIERFAPRPLAESYDNVGLMVGNPQALVSKIILSLDATEEVVDEAIECGAQMIVSHHPLIFSPLKSITGANDVQRTIIKAIKNDIAIYSAHTNADSTFGGVSYVLAQKLGLEDIKVLDPKLDNESVGLGCYGVLPQSTDIIEFLGTAKTKLGLNTLRYSKPHTQAINMVAVCGGSGASFISKAKALGVDLYLTGDIKYHDYFGPEGDITVADIGHYESEIFILEKFQEVIAADHDIEMSVSQKHRNPIFEL